MIEEQFEVMTEMDLLWKNWDGAVAGKFEWLLAVAVCWRWWQRSSSDNLDACLDALYEKRGTTRENALSIIVHSLRMKLQHQFVANKCITLLHQCLNSFKKGSTKEIHLASLVIGLLSVTAGCEEGKAQEILEESFAPLSLALKSGTDSLKISSILDCLAILTFIGGVNEEETERSMQIMWQFIKLKLGPNNVVASKPTPATLTAAISA
ncbi:hypothetical protein MKW98_015963 [Papaver atlanticum]|uniref:Interferon-related developmental regulator N-terminal domain-containing protein n=1 Tax=Papaver atlanticum TaxID=357466 RepID=A0AAD4X4B5_9MAGN|nr:hypothetical protein MKW98_015963 [Papaver atlanticum]